MSHRNKTLESVFVKRRITIGLYATCLCKKVSAKVKGKQFLSFPVQAVCSYHSFYLHSKLRRPGFSHAFALTQGEVYVHVGVYM